MGAGAATGVGMGMQAAGGIYGAYGSVLGGQMQSQYYSYLANQSKMEAALAASAGNEAAKETETSAGFEEKIMQRNEARALGAQTATLAANGNGGSVTAQNVEKSAMNTSALNLEAVRYNADTKAKSQVEAGELGALNYSMNASMDELAGANAKIAGNMNAVGTILGSGGSMASQWYRYTQG